MATAAPRPFFYLLVEDNHTRALATTEPPWGRPLTGVAAAGRFEMTLWQHLKHVVIAKLGHHRMRTLSPAEATCCVVASPAERAPAASAAAAGPPSTTASSLWARPCARAGPSSSSTGRTQGTKDALCNSLWSPRSCAQGGDDVLVRLSGNAPGLQSEVATRLRRGFCRYLPPTPYLAHARSAAAAAVGARAPSPRPLRIAYAAASWGHVDADKHGFLAWRKALRNACKALGASNGSACAWVWISMSGQGAEKALQRYAHADFCLQPPGDTLPRPGILDALTSGCVPVIFHPEQATLWPSHWRPLDETSPSGVLFDFTKGVPRPRLRDRDHAQYAAAAEGALQSLVEMPMARLAELRRGVASAARAVVYARATSAAAAAGDAVDVFVESSMKAAPRAGRGGEGRLPEAAAHRRASSMRRRTGRAAAPARRRWRSWRRGGGGGGGGRARGGEPVEAPGRLRHESRGAECFYTLSVFIGITQRLSNLCATRSLPASIPFPFPSALPVSAFAVRLPFRSASGLRVRRSAFGRFAFDLY